MSTILTGYFDVVRLKILRDPDIYTTQNENTNRIQYTLSTEFLSL